MESSELVVLLIVCVGINTGSTQEYCQGGIDGSACAHVSTDNTSSCVLATLQCENNTCSTVISGRSRICIFTNIGANTVSQPIQCCYCNIGAGNIPSQWWDCENMTTPTPSIPFTDTALSTSVITNSLTTTSITMPTIVTMTTTTNSTTPTPAMATSNMAIYAVVPVVILVVVCLLVVCGIATIIILYRRNKLQKDTSYQKTLHQLDNTIYGIDEATYEDPNASVGYYELPDTANQQEPPIYSAVDEEETPANKSNGIDNQQAPPIYSAVDEEETPANKSNGIDNQQAPPIYSAVDEEETPANGVDNPLYNTVDDVDTSDEGLVYSAVVVKDGKKTTVKTMATPQDEDTEQTQDTVQPVDVIEGMVYSAVIRRDGKKTSVKITVK